MKKILFFITVTALGLNQMNAQDKGDIEMGFNAGISLANVSDFSNDITTDPRITFNIGASGEYYFSDRWGIKAKLIYDNKGWTDGFITNEEGENFTTDFKVSYVTLPVMANWHFGRNRNWYLNFGGYVGFLTGAKDSELGRDVKDGFSSTDFGIAYGIGYKFNINDSTKLFIEYDEQAGLGDIFEESAGETIRNNRSSINLGVLFTL